MGVGVKYPYNPWRSPLVITIIIKLSMTITVILNLVKTVHTDVNCAEDYPLNKLY